MGQSSEWVLPNPAATFKSSRSGSGPLSLSIFGIFVNRLLKDQSTEPFWKIKASVSLNFGRSLCPELETKFWLLICPFILVGSETNNLGEKFRIHDAALSRLAAVVAGAQLWIKGITESQLCWNFESVYLVHVAAFRVSNTWNSTCVFSAFSRI